jgi:hypothetical protein
VSESEIGQLLIEGGQLLELLGQEDVEDVSLLVQRPASPIARALYDRLESYVTQSERDGEIASQVVPDSFAQRVGVTLVLNEDCSAAMARENQWQQELRRDICAALRCETPRFQYVCMCPGSIVATFNILPAFGVEGAMDLRSAQNLASELTQQVYDPGSPLRNSPTTASAVDVMLHEPRKPKFLEAQLDRQVECQCVIMWECVYVCDGMCARVYCVFCSRP